MGGGGIVSQDRRCSLAI